MKGERKTELRLALSLGFRSIREMKRGMTCREWEELKALGRMERIGDERRDYVVAAAGAVGAWSMGWKGDLNDLLAVKPEENSEQRTEDTLVKMLDSMANDGSQHSNPGN